MAEKTGPSPFAGDCTELERPRTVQELANDGKEIPERYVYKESQPGERIADDIPVMDLPVIDLDRLLPSSYSEEELQKLQSALRSWGCFQVINHGIESCLLEEVRENGRKFFQLPKEEKQKHGRRENDFEGYGSDMVLFENQTLDWTDRIYLCVKPEDIRMLHYWPQNPKSFREVLEGYTISCTNLIEILFKSMAKSLGLADNSFLNQCGERPVMYARYNFYPPCPKPDLVWGLKPHADASTLSVVLPDREVEGLDFLKDDQWVRVRTGPRALVVIVGDQVEMMSNGIFKSPIHRVATNKEKERMSVAMFASAGVGEEVGPVEELISDRRPRMYKTVNDYPEIFSKYYKLGRRSIEAVKL